MKWKRLKITGLEWSLNYFTFWSKLLNSPLVKDSERSKSNSSGVNTSITQETCKISPRRLTRQSCAGHSHKCANGENQRDSSLPQIKWEALWKSHLRKSTVSLGWSCWSLNRGDVENLTFLSWSAFVALWGGWWDFLHLISFTQSGKIFATITFASSRPRPVLERPPRQRVSWRREAARK